MDLSQKIVYNARYGNGHIEKIENDLIWVLFDNNENAICFHLLSAFTGETPFLKTEDKELLAYIDLIIKDNVRLEMKEEALANLKQLGIADSCVNAFRLSNTIHFIEGKKIAPVDSKFLKAIKEFEQESNALVYAVLNIPDNYGEKTARYIFLCIERYANIKSFMRKGKCCFVRGKIWNRAISQIEYWTSVGLHLTDSGIWCMPLSCCEW